MAVLEIYTMLFYMSAMEWLLMRRQHKLVLHIARCRIIIRVRLCLRHGRGEELRDYYEMKIRRKYETTEINFVNNDHASLK